jgi:hypothetical protein
MEERCPPISVLQVVLLLFCITVCISFFTGKLEAKDFMMLSGMVFSFWFGTTVPKGG